MENASEEIVRSRVCVVLPPWCDTVYVSCFIHVEPMGLCIGAYSTLNFFSQPVVGCWVSCVELFKREALQISEKIPACYTYIPLSTLSTVTRVLLRKKKLC